MIGLLFIAVGTGGIKPCVSAFGADQFSPDQVGSTGNIDWVIYPNTFYQFYGKLIISQFSSFPFPSFVAGCTAEAILLILLYCN